MTSPSTSGAPKVTDLHAYIGEFDAFGLKPLSSAWEQAGVGWIIGVGSDGATSEAATDAAWSLPNTIAGVGLHPRRIPGDTSPETVATLEDLEAITELASDPQVAVISDAGLDESASAPLETQQRVFAAMVELAVTHGRSLLARWHAPVDGLVEFWEELPARRRPPAALLSFNGDAKDLERLIELGFYFSLSPEAVGVRNAASVDRDVLERIPDERLFIHSSARPTDGNGDGVSPVVVNDIVQRLAEIRSVERDALADRINNNLWDFLRWRP